MTKTFAKFEFTPTEWATLRKLIEQTTTNPDGGESTNWVNCAVVELGFLPITPAVIKDMEVVTPAVLSEKWAVDILFYTEPPAEFTRLRCGPNRWEYTHSAVMTICTYKDFVPSSPTLPIVLNPITQQNNGRS
jgi:hypothetical protein